MTITDVLTELSVPFAVAGESKHVMNGWVGVDCSRCSPGYRKYKLGIRIGTTWATCWSCGGVNLIDALMEASGQPYARVKGLLEATGGNLPFEEDRPKSASLALPGGVGPLLPAHERYLSRRGLDVHACVKLWGVQGIGPVGKLAWRVFLPIRHRGKIVSWTTRAIGDKEPRYINAKPEQEVIPAKSVLFGSDHVGHAAIVCEGPFDAIRGGPGFVATLGTGWSQAQLLAIAKIPVRTVVFDNEPDAQRRAAKLCGELSAFPGVTRRVEIDAADPGSASAKEIELLRRRFL